MEDKDQFSDPLVILHKEKKVPVRQSVIKNTAVRIGKPKKIDQNTELEHPAGETDIKPILENGQVTGIIFTCSCGKVSEIRFDFDE